jgi:hypothetical protein
MTDQLEQAVAAARRLDPARQDEIAMVLQMLVRDTENEPIPLTADDIAMIARSREESARGDYANDEEIAAIWAKFGL